MQDQTHLRFNTVRAPEEPVAEETVVPGITLDYLFLGRSSFRVVNPDGKEYMYRVKSLKADDGDIIYFLNVRSSESKHRFDYVGKLVFPHGTLKVTSKSKFPRGTSEHDVAVWAIKCIKDGEMPVGYRIEHCGECGSCRAPLVKDTQNGQCDECYARRARFVEVEESKKNDVWQVDAGEWVSGNDNEDFDNHWENLK